MFYMLRVLLIVVLIFINFCMASEVDFPKLNIVYPKEDNTKISAESTYLIGSVTPQSILTINSESARVHSDGSFVEVVKLREGKNKFELKAMLHNQTKTVLYNIIKPSKPDILPHKRLAIDENSITPSQEIVLRSGEKITVSFRGATGNRATFSIGSKINIPMKETRGFIGLKGIYKGSYTIMPGDNFDNAPISVRLKSKFSRLTKTSKAKISILKAPLSAKVKAEKAISRTTPTGSRLTPQPKGSMIKLVGKKGNKWKYLLGANNEAWIAEEDIDTYVQNGTNNGNYALNLNVEKTDKKVLVKIPLSAPSPVEISENSNSSIELKIFGVKSKIEHFSFNKGNGFLKQITWKQPSKDVFKVEINTNSKQLWGYDYFYEGNTFVLALNKQPFIDKNCPLKGKIIAIDPGHGGEELGAIGPTGIEEKTVNLAMSQFLKQELEKSGAKVVMTRVSDDVDVDLFERPEIAKQNNADLLVSIHNNALPDGKDPYKEHGTSVYYYHPHSLELSKSIQKSLLYNTGFRDYGVHWASFVLTRPTTPISVLVEVGFMINPYEYALLVQPEFQKKTAIAIKNGIEDFYAKSVD